jgi:uncharacterized protein DUF1207
MRGSITGEGRCSSPSSLACGAVLTTLCALNVLPVAAEEVNPRDVSSADCRYEGIGMGHSDNAGSSPLEAFPENDVFRPLLADLKQPRFFAAWQSVNVRNPVPGVNIGSTFNVGSVGFGENFGLVGRRNGCDGWQVGLLGGVFAQFDMSNNALVNADYVIGVPVSWRSGLVSARVRLYHQSSHLGDEFLLGNPQFKRVGLTFEAIEALVSLDAPGGWGRAYAGPTFLIHREPETLERTGVQWGIELRGPTFRSIVGGVLPDLRMIPVFGTDFKTFEALKWNLNTNLVGGLEWRRAGSSRRVRFLVNYYNGYPQYGQFFQQSKIWLVGFGIYLEFWEITSVIIKETVRVARGQATFALHEGCSVQPARGR